MRQWSARSAAVMAASLLAGIVSLPAGAEPTYQVSGPVAHDNLAVYFLRGASAEGPVPLTLAEALAEGVARVIETGDVNQLAVENIGSEPIFIQAGDIVKGGQQDRVVSVSMLLAPGSGRKPLGAFCVEQGRWAARGNEDVQSFASSDLAMPSLAARMVMAVPEPSDTAGAAEQTATADTVGERQSKIWLEVAKIKAKLEEKLAASITSPVSATSLQLALENGAVDKQRNAYLNALKAAGEGENDILGAAFAINGRLVSIDLYPSNGLFRKMWPKLLAASATEALGELGETATAVPAPADVLKLLDASKAARMTEQRVDADNQVAIAQDDTVLSVATTYAGQLLHRNLLVH